MKKIGFLLGTAFLVLAMGACGGAVGSDYNPNVCEELQQKLDNNEDLTSDDYSEMISQVMDALKQLDEKVKASGDPTWKSIMEDEKSMETAKYAMEFATYLGMHQNQLSPENLKKFKEVQKYVDQIQQGK